MALKVGSIKFDSQHRIWRVVCEPHVSLRLKRVFASVGRHQTGKFELSDTLEIARDLQWFMERYPLEADAETLALLNSRASSHRERETVVSQFLSGMRPMREFDLALPPREYQKTAADLALSNGSLLLADDVGLGKSAASICTLTEGWTLPALVVTLTHLPRQWRSEIEKFAPHLDVHIVKKGEPYPVSRQKKNGQLSLMKTTPDVFIINYHKLAGWAETFAQFIQAVIFDECQELRHAKNGKSHSKRYWAARHIAQKARLRMGLSATPFYNYGGEMFNVMDVLAPGSLGTPAEFATEWCNGNTDVKATITSPKAFGAYMRSTGLLLRRTRVEVGRELPPITKIPHFVDSDTSALDKVSASCAELAKLILAQGETHRGAKMQASEEFSNKLRQATGIGKAPFVADFVRLLAESGEKVVLYGWHRAVYDIWLDRLKDLNPALYTGSESVPAKEESKRRFIAGETPIMMISLRAGAGLDGLQHVCRTVVFGELDWSPGVHEQALGRVARDGQKDPVAGYFLLSEEGSDPIVAQVLGIKRQQIEGVRDPNASLIEELSSDPDRIKLLAKAWLDRKKGAAAEAR